MSKIKKVTVSIVIEEKIKKELIDLSGEQDRSFSSVIRLAIREYIGRHKGNCKKKSR